MSSSVELHPTDSRLLQFSAGELPNTEAATVQRHLASCTQCAREVAALRTALSDIRASHDLAKRQAPPPPEPWFDLRERLQQLDAGQSVLSRRKPLFFVSRRWAAAAAGLVAALLLYRTVIETPLSAAELLREASRRESQTVMMARQNIRIRTSAGASAFVRPARLERANPAESADLPARFAAVNFSWEEPLSARAFARWRSTLSQKQDRVRLRDSMYEVTTTTEESQLASASITLRADDMKAVTETLRFRDGFELEITEAAPTVIEPPPTRPADSTPPLQTADSEDQPPPAVTASDELRVLAALHRIGADLGEPVEVERNETGISVKVLGGSAQRREQIRAALDSLPNAQLSFEDPQPVRDSARKATPEAASIESAAGPLVEQLRAVLPAGTDLASYTDDILLASEAATARAFAIRNLADRFPPHTEQELTGSDRQTLRELAAVHAGALRGHLDELERLLKPLRASEGFNAIVPSHVTWQAQAELVLNTSRQLDRAVSQALAVPEAEPGIRSIEVVLFPLTTQVSHLSGLLARVE